MEPLFLFGQKIPSFDVHPMNSPDQEAENSALQSSVSYYFKGRFGSFHDFNPMEGF